MEQSLNERAISLANQLIAGGISDLEVRNILIKNNIPFAITERVVDDLFRKKTREEIKKYLLLSAINGAAILLLAGFYLYFDYQEAQRIKQQLYGLGKGISVGNNSYMIFGKFKTHDFLAKFAAVLGVIEIGLIVKLISKKRRAELY